MGEIEKVLSGMIIMQPGAFEQLASAPATAPVHGLDSRTIPTTDGVTRLTASFEGSLQSTVDYHLDIDQASLAHPTGRYLDNTARFFGAPDGGVVVVYRASGGAEVASVAADGDEIASGPLVYDVQAPGVRLFAAEVPREAKVATIYVDGTEVMRFVPADELTRAE